ncbi:MAG: C69 family dipeptidase [Paludibacteraceae bacterium]|nr:C69 family dipeptidase [Paludibacteraceae bacterium]
MRLKQLLLCCAMLVADFSYAGTNIMVGKACSADGSTFCTYSVDSYYQYGELSYYPAAENPKYAKRKIYGWETKKYQGVISESPITYAVLGNMNEYQVCITESTFGGREELVDTTGVLDYGNLIYITLQRSKTAEEAIRVMTDLVAEYGYRSKGETFSIADPNNVWILEMIGKGPDVKGAVWVARRVPDDCVCAHANHSRITTFPLNDRANCRFSKDVISFAREKGYFKGRNAEFSFSDAYDPLSFSAHRFCDAKVWSAFRKIADDMDHYYDYIQGKSNKPLPLWVKPKSKLTINQLKNLMRDHFEGTPLAMTSDPGAEPFGFPNRFAPRVWTVDSVYYFNETPTAGPQNAFSFVAQMRSWLPNMVGGVLWYGVDDATFNVYCPIYCGVTEVPECFRKDNGSMLKFSWNSAYWVFNWVSNMAYNRYGAMSKDILRVQSEVEKNFEDNLDVIEEAAKSLYRKSPEYAANFLTEYSVNKARATVERWQLLGQFLLVKYTDGVVKKERNGRFIDNGEGVPELILQPGYSDWFYRQIVKETGDRYRLPDEFQGKQLK